ncbi:N-6 DNA methylase [Pseudonocardia asaccharolytica]|uniref:Type II restriction endonuclease subunit M n=1 Tax=Pseudonocardia asaccharolytica DSM 44247 = NBRC 16224 TaxID=1123024 RepID=A0A511D0Z5_9PSEU|nr:N-6 DNA methylase [Pseudonocardia asaccharolytica]GEL18367.1 type II restriction endonuclease subunit M [Pseudonocardia asaccharolytica DSM 44247 = NBRC 16224]
MNNGQLTDATVAAVDIARLAGVGRAAVGNWRRRFTDFPEPVGGTASSPLYRLSDVEQWLTRHGRGIRVSAADRVWQWLRTETDDLQLGALIGHLGAFVVFVHREPATWRGLAAGPDEQLGAAAGGAVTAAVPELPGRFPDRSDAEWIGALRTVADVVAERGAPATFEFLVGRYLDAHSRRLSVTSSAIAALIVRLAQVQGRSVLDPACGTGELLTAADAAGASTLAGQDLARAAARLTGAQLLLRRSGVEIVAGDSLRAPAFADRRFGAVVCNPPFADRDWGYDELAGDPRWEYGLPPRGEPELAWVQHCLAHAEPGGLVVLVMPPGAALRRPGRRIRGNLLRSGALRAVIGLPADGGPQPDLWVLRRPRPGDTPPSTVLMVVAPDLDLVTAIWDGFRADPARGDTEHSRAVRIIDLLDDEVDLSPARHVPSPSAVTETNFDEARAELVAALVGLPGLVPELATLPTPRELPMTTLGELTKAGVVELLQAPIRTTLDEGDLPVLTVKDVTARRGPTGRTREQPGIVLLQPGDVVAPAMAGRDMAVRVITEPGAVLGPRLLSFRADPDRLDPYFLAGFLSIAGSSSATRGTSALSRTDARRVPIPLLPPDEQRGYGEAFRRLFAFSDALRRSTKAGEALIRLGFEGLAGGRLAAER